MRGTKQDIGQRTIRTPPIAVRNCRNSAPTRNLPRAVHRGYHNSRSDMHLNELAWTEAETGSANWPMSGSGLGCAKTPAVAPHVEISPSNCIPESQIILHTRGVMPSWRIVFSTFRDCMSFYTARVIRVRPMQSTASSDVRFTSNSVRISAEKRIDAERHYQGSDG